MDEVKTKDEEVSVSVLTPAELKPTTNNPKGLMLFNKIKVARQALMAEAEEVRRLFMQNIMDAMAEGQHEVAQDGLKWLMEHTPADEDGVRMIDQGIDKPKAEAKGSGGPQINIGVQLGGLGMRKSLPGEVVEVEDE